MFDNYTVLRRYEVDNLRFDKTKQTNKPLYYNKRYWRKFPWLFYEVPESIIRKAFL